MKISKNNSEHYTWGDNCDGWRLMNKPDKSIIQEMMPPGTSEIRHYHEHASQFFFVLSGVLTIELNGEKFELAKHEGLEIPAKTPHQVFNKSGQNVEFMVISQPNATGDRIIV